MFNHKGMTLIESLFAFEIYVVIIITIVILFQTMLSHNVKLNQHYQKINEKEESISYQEDFSTIVRQALR